ncbi:hypothetical protein KR51_00018440 [Rubidibacter lacunae KORDI 51-2]|uniref:Uncharacterized protein n=1 Tax=Rubidibacter lacunae KORDI 51-2 TaxID=582515 RepID=U5DAQ4_9CHRO|nr:hypothetical protein [Rubidibacter lacunae]ERN41618.1 hypothetical protein KR51_00018440 [Rubidibacter lacunae KORDI 51-2]
MFGTFQQSHIRIEIEATAAAIRDSLTRPSCLQEWLWPQRLQADLPERLHPGLHFTSWLGPVAIEHDVEVVTDLALRMLLNKGIDGFHEWHWGDGWVQSRLEGISLLPLNLGQTLSLMKLREYITQGDGDLAA